MSAHLGGTHDSQSAVSHAGYHKREPRGCALMRERTRKETPTNQGTAQAPARAASRPDLSLGESSCSNDAAEDAFYLRSIVGRATNPGEKVKRGNSNE